MPPRIALHLPERLGSALARSFNGRPMSFQTLDELRQVLVDLELVSPQQLAMAIDEIGNFTRQRESPLQVRRGDTFDAWIEPDFRKLLLAMTIDVQPDAILARDCQWPLVSG